MKGSKCIYGSVGTAVLKYACKMLCLGATRTQHSEQYTNHTYGMLPHHRITYNDVVFFLPNFNLNIILARL